MGLTDFLLCMIIFEATGLRAADSSDFEKSACMSIIVSVGLSVG